MFKQLRGPERLFRIGQWIVAVLFAYFLSEVGASLIADLPLLSRSPTIEEFQDRTAIAEQERLMAPMRSTLDTVGSQLADRRKTIETARENYAKAKESFDNWRAARSATEQSIQNPEVIARTQELDRQLKAQQALEQQAADLSQQEDALQAAMRPHEQAIQELREAAGARYDDAVRRAELQSFAIRLAFVAPILAAALWLFRRHRKSKQWPFVWGYIFFALLAFFVELVPYLPSFGGYIRYGVGAILTFFGGRALIQALQRYIERKQQEQAAPREERKQDISYEKALDAIAKNQCPSCERSLPVIEGTKVDYCVHCGLKLFDACGHCGLRKNAFFHFCPTCGTETHGDRTAVPSVQGRGQ